MNEQDVMKALQDIENERENDLYISVLEAIASGQTESMARLASLALKTRRIPFAGW